jgi:hypothetical protein
MYDSNVMTPVEMGLGGRHLKLEEDWDDNGTPGYVGRHHLPESDEETDLQEGFALI